MTEPRTRRTPKKTRDWRPDFLAAFEQVGTVKAACVIAQVGRSTVYDERKSNEEFALAWEAVEEDTTDELEVEAVKRAKDGSDTLLIFLLKCRRPAKYQDRARLEHSGPNGGPVAVASGVDLTKLSDEDLGRLNEMLERATPDPS